MTVSMLENSQGYACREQGCCNAETEREPPDGSPTSLMKCSRIAASLSAICCCMAP